MLKRLSQVLLTAPTMACTDTILYQNVVFAGYELAQKYETLERNFLYLNGEVTDAGLIGGKLHVKFDII